MKNEEGKGSKKLIIAIVVIGIVVALGVRYTIEFFNKESIKDLQADLLLVKAKIEVVKGNNSMDSEANPLKGYQLTQLPEDIKINEFLDKHVIAEEEYEKYYLLDSRKPWTNGFERFSW